MARKSNLGYISRVFLYAPFPMVCFLIFTLALWWVPVFELCEVKRVPAYWSSAMCQCSVIRGPPSSPPSRGPSCGPPLCGFPPIIPYSEALADSSTIPLSQSSSFPPKSTKLQKVLSEFTTVCARIDKVFSPKFNEQWNLKILNK